MLYIKKEGNRFISKTVFVFKNMSYDCIGIFCRTYLFNMFIKKDFKSEEERERVRMKEEEGRERKERNGRIGGKTIKKSGKGISEGEGDVYIIKILISVLVYTCMYICNCNMVKTADHCKIFSGSFVN